MSAMIELANRMNRFNLAAEKSRNQKEYDDGKLDFDNIKLHIRFVTSEALGRIEDHLNDNGKIAYEKYFKKHVLAEIARSKQKWR